ncbi:MAG: substrate-binding domain-containing protein, partial [bacterium]|nr:substrate-binding domain-containing protein [bacterium]
AIGLPTTSVGYYTQQALVSDGAAKGVESSTHGYASQQAAIDALLSGENDIAVVYASAAAQNPKLHVSCVVREDLHEDIRYLAMATRGNLHARGVEALLKLLSEDPAAQKTMGGYGYIDRATAMVENR